eukprot:11376001-Alexandrium_andersonii.AAC.1
MLRRQPRASATTTSSTSSRWSRRTARSGRRTPTSRTPTTPTPRRHGVPWLRGGGGGRLEGPSQPESAWPGE